MAARLFAGGREVPVASIQTALDVAHVVAALGHRVRWDGALQVLYVDSPVQGLRIVLGYADSDDPLLWEQAWHWLIRRFGSAGAVVAGEHHGLMARALTIRLSVRTAGVSVPAVQIVGFRPVWKRWGLAQVVARQLQGSVDLAVDVRSRLCWRRAPMLLVRLFLGREESLREQLLQRSLEGLWLGVMRYYARREAHGMDDDYLELLCLQQGQGQSPVPPPEVGRVLPRPAPLYVWNWQRAQGGDWEVQGAHRQEKGTRSP